MVPLPLRARKKREGRKAGRLNCFIVARAPSGRVPLPSSLPLASLEGEDIAVSLLTDIRIVSRELAKSADLDCIDGTESETVHRATRCSSTGNHSRSWEVFLRPRCSSLLPTFGPQHPGIDNPCQQASRTAHPPAFPRLRFRSQFQRHVPPRSPHKFIQIAWKDSGRWESCAFDAVWVGV